jgi:hypothetical protein
VPHRHWTFSILRVLHVLFALEHVLLSLPSAPITPVSFLILPGFFRFPPAPQNRNADKYFPIMARATEKAPEP